MKFNIVKAANGLGMALGVVGTILTGWAGQKMMKAAVVKEVAEQIAKYPKH